MSHSASHGLPFVDASEVGMSAERLARIETRFKSYVDESLLSGWALTIAREGKIALSASCGLADRENNKPITDDTTTNKPSTMVLKNKMVRFDVPGMTVRWRSGGIDCPPRGCRCGTRSVLIANAISAADLFNNPESRR